MAGCCSSLQGGGGVSVCLSLSPAHPSLAVRVNANLDLVVSAVDLLRTLNVTAGAVGDSPLLTTLSELGALVGSSMQHCAGVERVLTDQAVFQQTVEAALTLRHSVRGSWLMALVVECALPHAVPRRR